MRGKCQRKLYENRFLATSRSAYDCPEMFPAHVHFAKWTTRLSMRDFKKQKKTLNKHENTRKETKFKEEGGGEE